MRTKREIGNELEDYLAGLIQKVDKYARRTKASGASTELGDTYNKYFITSCKNNKTKSNITIKKKEWDKLCADVPIGSQKIPVYVLGNKENDRFIVLDLDTFFSKFVYEVIKNEN